MPDSRSTLAFIFSSPPWLPFLISAAIAVFAAETQRGRLLCVSKPLTTLLLLGVVGAPHSPFSRWIAAGIGFSLVGDIALLFASGRAFMIGLASFLAAHTLYSIAFASKATLAPSVLCYGASLAAVTLLLLRRSWAGAAGLRGAVVVYAGAIAAMATLAFATMAGGALPPVAARLAAAGALLFFVSDSALALSRFDRPIAHAPFLTLGAYWLGQLGISWAARLG